MRKNRITPALFFAFFVFTLLIGCRGNIAQQDNTVVATVNGTKITRSDIDNEYKMAPFAAPLLGKAGFAAEQQKKVLLLDLIDQTVIQQKADEEGIKVTNQQVEVRYKLFRTGRSREQLVKELEDMGLDEQALLRNIKKQITAESLFNKVIKTRKATEQEAEAYFEKNKARYPDLTYKEARALIVPKLEQAKWAEAQKTWLDQAKRDSDIRLYGW